LGQGSDSRSREHQCSKDQCLRDSHCRSFPFSEPIQSAVRENETSGARARLTAAGICEGTWPSRICPTRGLPVAL
jgi:hypothetical protein